MLLPHRLPRYASLPLALPPEDAAVGLARALEAEAPRAVLAFPGGTLRLEVGSLALGRPSAWWPLYVARGVLTAGIARVPIEVEVLPWSDGVAELGLRPVLRRAHLGAAVLGPDRFRERASAALHTLDRAISARMLTSISHARHMASTLR